MGNKEIKRNRPYTHDCNESSVCQDNILRNELNDCATCSYFLKKFTTTFQAAITKYEWIPWELLSNINEIARGGFVQKCLKRAMFINNNERIAYGLDSIHSSAMIHHDLHLGNILQLATYEVNIGDLGLCQPTTRGKDAKEKKTYGVIQIHFTGSFKRRKILLRLVILKCWDPNPENHPNTRELIDELYKLLYTNSEFRSQINT
ncbi:hypothetical protein G9A89_013809 [Geosiphon pyriformis]|nr:hypothetical protein G9A89_013809 [Geosiphon pyriformis]